MVNPFDPFGESDDPFNKFRDYRGPSERIDITELFSEKTKALLQEAAQITVAQKQRNIDSEHLLLALLKDSELTESILKELDLKQAELLKFTEAQMGTSNYEGTNIGLTPRAKQILQMAFQEALELGHNYIGPEHIFLGIVREGEGLGAQILRKHGISHTKARQAVISIVGEGDKEGKKFKAKSTTPELDKYSKDLTDQAKQGKIDPVIGRSDEITRVIEILARRKKNNPVLIGEPGVGKTAIIEGLAQRIISGNVPDILKDKKVKALDLGLLVGGSKFRGEFEERTKKLINEIEKAEREIILFIDELHTIVGSGAREGELDLANMIKPALARGDLQVIGATTISEYKKYVEKDAALERRFQPVLVEEPSIEQTIEILRGIRDKYEAHHRIKISDESLISASELSDRYIKDRFLPDKAIDVIDEAASKVRLRVTAEPDELRQLKTEIAKLERERESLTRSNKHKQAAEVKIRIEQIKQKITPLDENWKRAVGTGAPEVSVTDVAEVVSKITGIPVKELNSEGLNVPTRPLASFIFLGPSGVGKTELAKALAETVFGDEDAIVRLDMSEYMERHTVSRLIGSPPGYVGHEEGGQLTEKIRRHPYAVILLDEIEKAHPDIFNILLQILDDGRLTDGKGRTIDFKNTIIIATSNLGSQLILESLQSSAEVNPKNKKSSRKTNGIIKMKKEQEQEAESLNGKWDELKQKLMETMKSTFRPEFLNRIDEIIVFKPLLFEDIAEIIKLLLAKTQKLLHAQKIAVEFSNNTVSELARLGYDPQFGARPLRRIIQREIENPLSSAILEGKFNAGDKIKVDFKDSFIFSK